METILVRQGRGDIPELIRFQTRLLGLPLYHMHLQADVVF